ncbi:hypothetical protein MNBD_GAMMA17-1757 [hydrothermal vent metagenome]|uniref:Uncharacterized protein n=1 Tax=hydrothermal vent metagenome TaxID=652676 RepID=A0A3B0ZC79_9ZZZZ
MVDNLRAVVAIELKNRHPKHMFSPQVYIQGTKQLSADAFRMMLSQMSVAASRKSLGRPAFEKGAFYLKTL